MVSPLSEPKRKRESFLAMERMMEEKKSFESCLITMLIIEFVLAKLMTFNVFIAILIVSECVCVNVGGRLTD